MRPKVVCIYCNDKFRDNNCLNAHVKRLHSKLEIKCTFRRCSEFFLNQDDLNTHLRLQHQAQENLKLFGCSKCSYRSSFRYCLKRHVDQMHGVEQLQCPKCIKIFKCRLSLRRHLQNHRERRYCEHCCVQIFNLKRHLGQIQCAKCNYVAPCAYYLTSHIKSCK